MPKSTPRKKGDELLLGASGDGWVSREEVIRHMMQFVMPGQAHRIAARRRVREEDSRHRDPARVGSRQVANATLNNALKYGVWVRDGDRVRHRDWHPQGQEVAADAVAPAPGGFVVPTLAEMTAHSRMLHGFTKWHWAAVVACHVVEGEGRGKSVNGKSAISPEAFAAFDIAQLESARTVRKYLHIWLEHFGGVRPEPGQPVDIPDMSTWPTKRVRKRGEKRKTAPVKQPPKTASDEEWLAWLNDHLGAKRVMGLLRKAAEQTTVAQMASKMASNVVALRRPS